MREDLLDNEDAPKQPRDLDAEYRDDRDKRVAEHMAVEHDGLAQPLRPRDTHMVLPQHFEHRRTRLPHHHRREWRTERERGQDHMPEIVADAFRKWHVADRRQQAQLEREHEDEQRRQPEIRQRDANQA